MRHFLLFGLQVLIVVVFSPAQPVKAYTPDYSLILSKAAEHHGRGIYEIELDVVFQGDPDPLVVKETWLVGGENSMRLTLEGKGSLSGHVAGTLIYEEGRRFWLDELRSLKDSKLTEDWWEPFFNFRYSKNLKPRLVALRMAPPESLKSTNFKVSAPSGEMSYEPQSFIRLSRTGGVVNYAIGTPTPPEATIDNPGLWIEQDQFVVRKIRLPSQVLVSADQYARYPQNFWYPKVRTVKWKENSVQVHLTSVKPWTRKQKGLDPLKANSLQDKATPQAAFKLPDQPLIREFYQRFR